MSVEPEPPICPCCQAEVAQQGLSHYSIECHCGAFLYVQKGMWNGLEDDELWVYEVIEDDE